MILVGLFILVGLAQADRHLFTAFGDWGEYSSTMRSTISQMREQSKPEFIVLLGDSFYPKGVQSVDDPQFRLFDAFSDVCDTFYVALGNHDYGYSNSVQSMIARSEKDPKWILPSQYYLKRVYVDNEYEMCAIVLDTHIFESAQLAWLETQLRNCQGEKVFRYIFTHYPLLTVGTYANSRSVARLRSLILPLIDRYSVHAYISGHEHQSQVFERNNAHFIIAGATAQMNRNKASDKSKWQDELKFFNEKDAAILSFDMVDGDPGLMRYKLIKSSNGSVIYSSVIKATKPPSTTTETFDSYSRTHRPVHAEKGRVTVTPKTAVSPPSDEKQPETVGLVTDSNECMQALTSFPGLIWIFFHLISP